MARAKKVDEVAVLSERMLDTLRTQRTLGPGDYPPTLRRLAELCGIPPEDSRVLKAVAKKTFTEKAKAICKATLDSPVYFKEDVPSKEELERREVASLADRMVRVLESQRELGSNAYPTTFDRLARLCGFMFSNKLVTKAAAHETLAAEVIFGSGKPASDSPAILKRDLEGAGREWNSALLAFAFSNSRDEKGDSPKLCFTPKQLASKLQKPLQERFVEALNARIGRRDLPPEYAWLANKEPLIFRLDDIKPGPPTPSRSLPPAEPTPPVPPPPAREFAGAFREAFDRLDRRNGLSNHVKLVDLRRELVDFPRERFDAGLRQLRVDREFSLDSHEGLLRPLTPEEREAGISEEGSLFAYVSRR